MIRLLPALFCWLALLALPAGAHPSHTSFAEIDWSEDGSALEVSLRVIPEDLEEELALREGRPVTLIDSPALRTMLVRWLADNFVVSADGQALPITLVGMEPAYDETWLYFTVAADRSQALTLQYRVLQRYNRERNRVQLNQLQRLWAQPSDRLLFSDEAAQPLWPPTP